MEWRKTIWALVPLTICFLLSLQHAFFWDTTHLASAQADWFYTHGTNSLLLPDHIDSGHTPLTGWLLAWVWKIMGKGLIQSHLMMLPFLLVAVWHMLLTLRHFSNGGLGAYPFSIALIFSLYVISNNIGIAFGWLVWTSQTILAILLGLISYVLLPVLNRNK
jgi:hypothetical protein